MNQIKSVPSVSMTYAQNGNSARSNELGMRPMQERAYEKRGEQYLLIKAPPASGKSRALMFIALDKLDNQGLAQAIIAVPERVIGASFADAPLSRFGFHRDWRVAPQWNLCDAPGADEPRAAKSKVAAVRHFLDSGDRVLVCTHATLRFAVEELGVDAFGGRLIAVDEFHHVSADPDNKLGTHLGQFIARDKVHIVAMTGSYFRGDAVPVLAPEDEARFETVTYTYYEQLNGYEHLKTLDIGYYFYSGAYTDEILGVLDPAEKTIIHIPSVNSRESTKDKIREVEHIIEALGEWQGTDPATGFQLVQTPAGRVLRIADLVDDDAAKRGKVAAALKSSEQNNDRDHVDIIIALGMAKEGFDWIWCEHALTVGYRSSLTEIVQIIGRATRDAEGKTRARFTNLIAEPDASEEAVTEAVNDTLKAIAASLLMEQVLAPRFVFTPKHPDSGPVEGFDYGEGGYDPDKANAGFNEETGQLRIEIKGLAAPNSKEAERICREDLNEVITAFVQDKTAVERGMFDEELVPEELTQVRMGKIVKDKYPDLSDTDREAVRQHAVAALNLTQKAKEIAVDGGGSQKKGNTALIDGIRKYASRDIWDSDDALCAVQEAFRILAQGVGPDGTQLADERESLLWGFVNMLDAQTRRLDRAADKLIPELRDLQHSQDGSEIKARELELITDRAQNLSGRRDAFEQMRDAVADQYRSITGDVWRPRHGSHTSQIGKLTSAAIDARDFIRARKHRETAAHLPEGTLVAITGGKDIADPATVIARLDKAKAKYNDIILVHGGGPGVERIAARWAERNGVHQIVCKPDWNRHRTYLKRLLAVRAHTCAELL